MEYIANFDWDITKRKLVIFLPSFKYSGLTDFSISQIRTKIDPSKWIVIIGNDNVDTNWDHLKYRNVRYFTLLRDDDKPRNSCYIRNFAMKNSMSEFFLQKDAEVVVLGDFIHNVINAQEPWRAGNVYTLSEEQTDFYLKTAHLEGTIKRYNRIIDITPDGEPLYASEIRRKVIPNVEMQNCGEPFHPDEMKRLVLDADGRLNCSTYFQYVFGIKTEIVQEIRGYDEDYTSYGWEDTDLFCRLYAMNQYIVPDDSCTAIHLYHPRGLEHEKEAVVFMQNIFKSKNPEEFQRNPIGWGEGFKQKEKK